MNCFLFAYSLYLQFYTRLCRLVTFCLRNLFSPVIKITSVPTERLHNLFQGITSGIFSTIFMLSALLELENKPKVEIFAGDVKITWTNKTKATIPDNTLRRNILYDVRCYKCNHSICNKTSCLNEIYKPRQQNLTETKVIVSNLTIGDKYVFRVYAKNSLNDNVPQKKWKYVETDPYVIPTVHGKDQLISCTLLAF